MKQILLLARNTISQGIRMKVSCVFILFLTLIIPAFPFLLKSDGTAEGQIRIILSYSNEVITILLSLLTIFISVNTLSSEIKSRQITILDTKPVPRWKMLAGKWTGVMIINSVLLTVMGMAVFGLTQYVARTRGDDYQALTKTVLTARKSIRPSPMDIDNLTDRYIERMKSEGADMGPGGEESARRNIRAFFKKHQWSVPPGLAKVWEFRGLPQPESGQTLLTIQYKVDSSRGIDVERCPIRWDFGIGYLDSTRTKYTQDTAGTNHEFNVPARDLITPDGLLRLGTLNLTPESGTLIFPRDGLKILYPVRGFGMNYVYCLLSILLWLAFFAFLGIGSATILSFPVASLLCLFILFITIASGTVDSVMGEMDRFVENVQQKMNIKSKFNKGVSTKFIKTVLKIIPKYSDYNPVHSFSRGLIITGPHLIKKIVFLVFIRGLTFFLIGAFLFRRRELGGVV